MKLILMGLLLSLSSLVQAGGLTCRECPGENSGCAPRSDCVQDQRPDNVCADSAGACAFQPIGSACVSEVNHHSGQCGLLPLTAGGMFGHCLCYTAHD